jgi:tetratricopeptide (TPR) repeat protein
VSFFSRFLRSDYRQAVAAEAAGDYAEAARCYALAGEKDKVAEMHLLRAERANARTEEIAAYRDALRWAEQGGEVERRAARLLAKSILSKAKAEGVATEKDREAVREAAALLERAGDHGEAGQAWELLGDDDAAAKAYEKGGVVDRMELALARDEKRARAGRRLKESFEEYELYWKSGDRESARAALQRCVDVAEDKGEYRRLLDTLDGRRLAAGRVSLRRRPQGAVMLVCGSGKLGIGRDALCDLVLRAGGISRLHAEILADAQGFRLRDAGSRNGTLLGGLPISGELPLVDTGRFSLGEECELSFRIDADKTLRLEVARGLDKGVHVVVAAPSSKLALPETPATLRFDGGRPYLEAEAGISLRLNGAKIARGAIQLVREDVIALGDAELEIL